MLPRSYCHQNFNNSLSNHMLICFPSSQKKNGTTSPYRNHHHLSGYHLHLELRLKQQTNSKTTSKLDAFKDFNHVHPAVIYCLLQTILSTKPIAGSNSITKTILSFTHISMEDSACSKCILRLLFSVSMSYAVSSSSLTGKLSSLH